MNNAPKTLTHADTGLTFVNIGLALRAQRRGDLPRYARLAREGETETVIESGRVSRMGRRI